MCSKNISEELRQKVHDDFYRTKNQCAKWQFIRLLVQAHDPARPNDKEDPKRKQRKYHFLIDHQMIEVCQTMFLNTLVISEFMVRTALQKNIVSPERRGGKRQSREIPSSVTQSIRDHIASFPRVASHYCRAETTFEYLETNVKSVANMHRLYLDWMKDNKAREQLATRRQYEDEFINKHRIKFFQPRKDLCDECVAYSLTDKDTLTADQQQRYENHILAKDLANALAKEDKEKYGKGKNPEVVLCHMDLQKVLLLPKTF